MTFNEAPFSINIQFTTPRGFPGQGTFRSDDWDKLLESYLEKERNLVEKGFQVPPLKVFGLKPQKPIEYVEGRVCPKCGSKLVYFEVKGKKNIKCFTSRYDWKTKTTSGCDYIEWSNSMEKPKETEVDFPDMITKAQETLLNKMKTEGTLPDSIDINSLSKNEAKETIQKYKTW